VAWIPCLTIHLANVFVLRGIVSRTQTTLGQQYADDFVVNRSSIHRGRGVQLNAPTVNFIERSAFDDIVTLQASESMNALAQGMIQSQ